MADVMGLLFLRGGVLEKGAELFVGDALAQQGPEVMLNFAE